MEARLTLPKRTHQFALTFLNRRLPLGISQEFQVFIQRDKSGRLITKLAGSVIPKHNIYGESILFESLNCWDKVTVASNDGYGRRRRITRLVSVTHDHRHHACINLLLLVRDVPVNQHEFKSGFRRKRPD